MIKVSVIIPVYNVRTYLCQCLDSVLAQTLDDLEIICIDDGSTDGCAAILDAYAVADHRVRVFHQTNGGYGKAMNFGINQAAGEYIGIVESDDSVSPDMYASLYESGEKYNLDIVKSDYYLCYGNERILNHNEIYERYYNRVLYKQNYVAYFLFTMCNWTGIYRRQFLLENRIYHQETPGASYQDNGFWMQVMGQAQSAMWINKAFYLYRQDNPDASVRSTGKMMAMMNEFDYGTAILRQKGLFQEVAVCNFFRFRECRSTFLRIDDTLKEEYAHIIAKQYDKYKDTLCDLSFAVGKGLLEEIENISMNPEKVSRELIQIRKQIGELIDDSEELVLYGAGKCAQTVFKRLYAMNYWDKVSCVMVSDGLGEGKKFFGKNIQHFSTALKNGKKKLFILASLGNNAEVMKKNLEDAGYSKYVKGIDLINFFWSM